MALDPCRQPADAPRGAGLPFVKMQALGNDFVLLDLTRGGEVPPPELLRRLAHRRRGVGCDQVLVLLPPQAGGDLRMRVFNPDGGEAGQCGNGLRCVARYAVEAGLVAGPELRVETAAGLHRARVETPRKGSREGPGPAQVSVELGPPRLEPEAVPFRPPSPPVGPATYLLEAGLPDAGGLKLEVTVLSLGNPHAVLVVEDAARAPVAELGPALERHPAFPEGANVGFLEVRDRRRVRLRVHERGAGETPACGSGASAAVVAARLRGLLEEAVEVHLPGGRLEVRWPGPGKPVELTGPAERVFEGLWRWRPRRGHGGESEAEEGHGP